MYVLLQDNFPSVNESELKEMDRRITELQEKVKKTSEECHKMEGGKQYPQRNIILLVVDRVYFEL